MSVFVPYGDFLIELKDLKFYRDELAKEVFVPYGDFLMYQYIIYYLFLKGERIRPLWGFFNTIN